MGAGGPVWALQLELFWGSSPATAASLLPLLSLLSLLSPALATPPPRAPAGPTWQSGDTGTGEYRGNGGLSMGMGVPSWACRSFLRLRVPAWGQGSLYGAEEASIAMETPPWVCRSFLGLESPPVGPGVLPQEWGSPHRSVDPFMGLQVLPWGGTGWGWQSSPLPCVCGCQQWLHSQ